MPWTRDELIDAPSCALRTDRGRSWFATLVMLKRLKEQRVAVTAALSESSSSHNLDSDGLEWALLEGLTGILQPFKVVADMITSCRYPVISMVRPVLHMLISTTLKVKEEDMNEISMTKTLSRRCFQAHIQRIHKHHMKYQCFSTLLPS